MLTPVNKVVKHKKLLRHFYVPAEPQWRLSGVYREDRRAHSGH